MGKLINEILDNLYNERARQGEKASKHLHKVNEIDSEIRRIETDAIGFMSDLRRIDCANLVDIEADAQNYYLYFKDGVTDPMILDYIYNIGLHIDSVRLHTATDRALVVTVVKPERIN